MAKILAPNKEYTGVSASVTFANGVGETDNPTLLNWFKEHGYEVSEDTAEEGLEVPPINPKEPEGNVQEKNNLNDGSEEYPEEDKNKKKGSK